MIRETDRQTAEETARREELEEALQGGKLACHWAMFFDRQQDDVVDAYPR